MLTTRRTGFTLIELFLTILVVAIAFTVALPSLPAGQLSGPIEDPGPVDIRAFRLEFASQADSAAVESELRAVLPLDEPGRPSLCEVATRDHEPNLVYVGLWMPVSMSRDEVTPIFASLSIAPVRVTELPRE